MTGFRIPPMTDPLGRHWNQPKGLRERVGLFFNHATISEKDWNSLPRYESSMPSGIYAGKVWRRGIYLVWYGPVRNGACSVGYLRALVQGPGVNITHRPIIETTQ